MIDDLKYIHQKDAADALGIAGKQGGQYGHSFGFSWQPPRPIANVIVAGMGGSGLAAKATKACPGLSVPIDIVQDYQLPKYVSSATLIICSSYSGNTEEEVMILESVLNISEDKRPMLVVIDAGGKLGELAAQNKLSTITLPAHYQPRYSFGFQFRALFEIFDRCSLTNENLQTLAEDGQWLNDQLAWWTAETPTKDNYAKQLALELAGSSPVVYSSTQFASAAYKWKISFNENAKNIAWYGTYPEFNHNEFMGWISHPVEKPYKVVDLRSSFDHPRIKKRFELSDRMLSGLRPAAIVVDLKGDTIQQQLLWSVALGDFVSLYLALLNGLDPSPVDKLEEFKRELAS